MKQIVHFILIVVALGIILFVTLRNYCPASGLALTKSRREFFQLKNRTVLPQQSDFDGRVNLEAILQRGDDHSRWAVSHAAKSKAMLFQSARVRSSLRTVGAPATFISSWHLSRRAADRASCFGSDAADQSRASGGSAGPCGGDRTDGNQA